LAKRTWPLKKGFIGQRKTRDLVAKGQANRAALKPFEQVIPLCDFHAAVMNEPPAAHAQQRHKNQQRTQRE
jgi:hypothetical protein